jgi:predicted amidohydrolase YtcJ
MLLWRYQTDLTRYPTRYDIDEVVSDRPVFLWRACWHIGVANSSALRLSNVDLTQTSFEVEGGSVDTDENGPTGVYANISNQVTPFK